MKERPLLTQGTLQIIIINSNYRFCFLKLHPPNVTTWFSCQFDG